MALDFAGRVAIVTGSGRGLGRAHALMLASRNCHVVVNDIPAPGGGPGAAHDVVREITAAGGAAIADEQSVLTDAAAIVHAKLAAFGRLDIVVNNAGNVDHSPFEELSQAQYRQQMELHFFAAVDLCRVVWPHLKQSGSGRIVNTTSGGVYGGAGISNYAAAKAALLGFSLSLAQEAGPCNINVNCMAPNGKTRLTDVMNAQFQPLLEKSFAPERIAAFVAWLCHQDCTIHGEMFEAAAGMVTRVRFARQSFVHAGTDTPETWAENSTAVVTDAPLVAMPDGLSLFEAEVHELYPDFNMRDMSLLATQG